MPVSGSWTFWKTHSQYILRLNRIKDGTDIDLIAQDTRTVKPVGQGFSSPWDTSGQEEGRYTVQAELFYSDGGAPIYAQAADISQPFDLVE